MSLPKLNTKVRSGNELFTEEDIGGIICNPIYAGIAEYPPLLSDKQWREAAKIAIEIDGMSKFLRNVIHLLGESFNIQIEGAEKWVKEMEKLIENHDIGQFLSILLPLLRAFIDYWKEKKLKDMGKFYKKWRITSGIPEVIIQKIKILRIILNIWVLKSSKIRLLNHPILAIEFGRCWAYKSSKVGLSNPPSLVIYSLCGGRYEKI